MLGGGIHDTDDSQAQPAATQSSDSWFVVRQVDVRDCSSPVQKEVVWLDHDAS